MKKVLVVAVLLLTIKWSISRAAVVEGIKGIIHNTLTFKYIIIANWQQNMFAILIFVVKQLIINN